jgi:sugar diacid utilization regulator
MSDLAPDGGRAAAHRSGPASSNGSETTRDRSSRGLFALVPTAVPVERRAQLATADPLTPDLALIDPARLDVMFDPANLRRPILACVIERTAAILDGVAVLQTPRMIVVERAGPGDPGNVALRPESRPEDREALDRAVALGGATVLPARGARPRRLVVALRGCGELLGFLVATARSDGPWPRAVVARAARTLALVMVVSADAGSERDHRRAELFDDLVAGIANDRIGARAAVLGHDLSRPHRAFAFSADAAATGDATATLAQLRELVAAQCEAVAPGEPASLVGCSAGRVLAFVPRPRGREPESDPKGFAGAVIAAAARAGLSVSAGIGATCADPDEFRREARHAARALGVLAMTGRSGAIAAHDDLGVYGLLLHSDDPAGLDEFVRRWIGPLLDYDREHHSELTRTLGRLLEEATLAEAADALFVHTSTLKYRVKRIEEILGMTIRDPGCAFHLQLATTIHRVHVGLGRA